MECKTIIQLKEEITSCQKQNNNNNDDDDNNKNKLVWKRSTHLHQCKRQTKTEGRKGHRYEQEAIGDSTIFLKHHRENLRGNER